VTVMKYNETTKGYDLVASTGNDCTFHQQTAAMALPAGQVGVCLCVSEPY
jgi:hypothetical protein